MIRPRAAQAASVRRAGDKLGIDAKLDERTVIRYAKRRDQNLTDKRTAALFAGLGVKDLPIQIQRRARAKLLAVDAARRLASSAGQPT